MEQAKEEDLKTLFSKLSIQSKANNVELRSLVPASHEIPDRDETRLTGKFYRAWMDIKNAIDSGNRKKILPSCEYGEVVAKKAYQDALSGRSNLSPDADATFEKQYDEILKAHNQVKALRDSA